MGLLNINAQMGNTITGKYVIGCSKDGAPWIKLMVVVMLSCTVTGKDTTIVGPCKEAIDTTYMVCDHMRRSIH